MGCVQSHQQERGGRRQSGDRRSPQHRQQQQQQQRHRQQQPQQNGRQQQQQPSRSRERIPSEHLYENVDSQQNVVSRGNSPAKTNNDDSQFRRQQFDRNSCLRHSKKRKKSSLSNPNSPATLTGNESSEHQQQLQQKVGKTSSNQNSPTNNNRPVDENGEVFKYDLKDYQIRNEEQPEEQKQQYSTASSKVAALLAADSIKQPVPLVNSNKPVLLYSTITRETSNANSVQEMPQTSVHSNGIEENHLPSKPTPVTLSSPTKMQKLSTSSSSTTTSTTTTTSATTKTTVGPNQRRPGSGQTGNRVVLRTRRQAAQEEEEQRRRKNCDGPELDENEDCGRLI